MNEIIIKLHPSISEIGELIWDSMNNGNLFTSYAYLHALETSNCLDAQSGWQVNHLSVVNNAGEIIGLMPLYLKYHSQGEYVFDHGWAEGYARFGGQYYPKLLCASPFTPVSGARILAKDKQTRAAILDAAKTICDNNQLSSLHINFPTKTEWLEMGENGYLLRQNLQYWWDNDGYTSFDDFLGKFNASRRKVIKRERRDALAMVEVRTIMGDELNETHMDYLYSFINATYDRKWGSPYLTREFFSQILQTMRDKIILFFAYQNDECIAGAINFWDKDTLYGRQWGTLRDIPFLHFEICYYQAIEFAIKHGIKRVEAGTQGEHKLSRGYLPHPVYSAHYIRDEALRVPVADFLRREMAAIEGHIGDLRVNASPFKTT